ncbi:MAG: hypothetical protein Q9178_005720 [Gyalolechia marmorata]
MEYPVASQQASIALARTSSISQTKGIPLSTQSLHPVLPPISEERLRSSLWEQTPPGEEPPDDDALKDASSKHKTYLYLAYGSNLASSTFRGVRGIRPLAALNVVVPSLILTFDLPGLPYIEPCFANTAYKSSAQPPSSAEKAPLLPRYSNPYWPKGLVGVVYEVTPTDYAHIIATEGGGASYHDVLVKCHPLPPAYSTVPAHPDTPPFKAHTLYSPLAPTGTPSERKDGGRLQRPDPEYAQPSRRYIDLIITGAAEHGLPTEYREYLSKLQPYTITTRGQQIGKFIFMMTWLPIIRAVFMLSKMFSDDKGRSPNCIRTQILNELRNHRHRIPTILRHQRRRRRRGRIVGAKPLNDASSFRDGFSGGTELIMRDGWDGGVGLMGEAGGDVGAEAGGAVGDCGGGEAGSAFEWEDGGGSGR